jgi:hypothetical protein
VRLFQSTAALADYVKGSEFDDSVDGITLLQEYIRAPEPVITRVEFIGGKFLYAVQVDTSLGFELCPADVCQIGDAFCPVGTSATSQPKPAAPRFRILADFDHPILADYQRFLAHNGIEIAGIEFIADSHGRLYTYDVNTNTNYNSAAEAQAKKFGMRTIARFLGRELHKLAESAQPDRVESAALAAGSAARRVIARAARGPARWNPRGRRTSPGFCLRSPRRSRFPFTATGVCRTGGFRLP